MPDFLNKKKTPEPSAKPTDEKPSDTKPSGGNPAIPNEKPRRPRAFRTQRPGSGRRGEELTPEQKKGKKKKEPSKLFVHYYGSVFLLLIAGFVAAGYFLLSPLITEFKEVNETIGTKLTEVDDARAFLESLDLSIQAAESIPEDTLMRVDEALPRDVGIPKLLKTIAEIATEYNVEVSSVQFAPGAAAKKEEGATRSPYRGMELSPIDINLTVDAPGYQVTRAFLEALETNVRVLDVNTISVTGEDDGAMSYTMTLTAYTLKKQERYVPVDMMGDEMMGGEVMLMGEEPMM